jgi:hypothetical protein
MVPRRGLYEPSWANDLVDSGDLIHTTCCRTVPSSRSPLLTLGVLHDWEGRGQSLGGIAGSNASPAESVAGARSSASSGADSDTGIGSAAGSETDAWEVLAPVSKPATCTVVDAGSRTGASHGADFCTFAQCSHGLIIAIIVTF